MRDRSPRGRSKAWTRSWGRWTRPTTPGRRRVRRSRTRRPSRRRAPEPIPARRSTPADEGTEGAPASAPAASHRPDVDPARSRGTLDRRLPALASPVYRRFLAGAFVGTLGSWMQTTAQGWLVLDLTDSSALLGVT